MLVARDVMSPKVLRVRDDMSVAQLATFLTDHEISGAPVDDAGGKLVGVVSVADVASAASELAGTHSPRPGGFFSHDWEAHPAVEDLRRMAAGSKDLLVRDIMTRGVYSVPDDTPVADVAEIMLDSHIHRLLVTQGARTVGIISSSDLLGLLVGR